MGTQFEHRRGAHADDPSSLPVRSGARGRCFHELFEEQAARTPDAIALEFGGRELTYAGLNARANRLAQELRGAGIGPERLAGLYCARPLELTVGVLDAVLPPERLAYILDDARPELVLTQSKLAARLPESTARVLDAPARRRVEE